MIEYISVEKLTEHPDNPRKDIGDVSELCASIQKQGLLQNLTVVPHPEEDGKYRIVIGHRRFNAAKMAGLKELPCVIDRNMDIRAQIAVMMSENMQRNDLTVAERVGGVQMMFDLGLDVKAISADTGLSETSVRRYKKLGKIGKSLKAAEEAGATLFDLEKIAEIQYADIREKALSSIGSGDLRRFLYEAENRQKKEKLLPKMREKIEAFATRFDKVSYQEWSYKTGFRFSVPEILKEIENFKPAPGKRYAYVEVPYELTLYEEVIKDPKAEEKRKSAEKMRLRADHERELAKAFEFSRKLFMAEYRVRKETEDAAKRFILWTLTSSECQYALQRKGAFWDAFLQNRGQETEGWTDTIRLSPDEILVWDAGKLLTACLLAAYDRIDAGGMSLIDRYTGKIKEKKDTKKLRTLYEFMLDLGYRLSDEENAWLNGTHECYTYPHEEGETNE